MQHHILGPDCGHYTGKIGMSAKSDWSSAIIIGMVIMCKHYRGDANTTKIVKLMVRVNYTGLLNI